jgi:hypothetical protein
MSSATQRLAARLRKRVAREEEAHRLSLTHLWDQIRGVEAPAREAYSRSQDGVHNLYTRGWEELTDAERNDWIRKVNDD